MKKLILTTAFCSLLALGNVFAQDNNKNSSAQPTPDAALQVAPAPAAATDDVAPVQETTGVKDVSSAKKSCCKDGKHAGKACCSKDAKASKKSCSHENAEKAEGKTEKSEKVKSSNN